MGNYDKELDRLNKIISKFGNEILDIDGDEVDLYKCVESPEFVENNLTEEKLNEIELLCDTLFRIRAKMSMIGKGGIIVNISILDNTIVFGEAFELTKPITIDKKTDALNILEYINTETNNLPIGCKRRLVKLYQIGKVLNDSLRRIEGSDFVISRDDRNILYPENKMIYTSPFEYFGNVSGGWKCLEDSMTYRYVRCSRVLLVGELLKDEIDTNRIKVLSEQLLEKIEDIIYYYNYVIDNKEGIDTIDKAKSNGIIQDDMYSIVKLKVLYDMMNNDKLLTTIRNISSSLQNNVNSINNGINNGVLESGMKMTINNIMRTPAKEVRLMLVDKNREHVVNLTTNDFKPVFDLIYNRVSIFGDNVGKNLKTESFKVLSEPWKKAMESL
jgi:hypothetical protein